MITVAESETNAGSPLEGTCSMPGPELSTFQALSPHASQVRTATVPMMKGDTERPRDLPEGYRNSWSQEVDPSLALSFLSLTLLDRNGRRKAGPSPESEPGSRRQMPPPTSQPQTAPPPPPPPVH